MFIKPFVFITSSRRRTRHLLFETAEMPHFHLPVAVQLLHIGGATPVALRAGALCLGVETVKNRKPSMFSSNIIDKLL